MKIQQLICYWRAAIELLKGKGFHPHDYIEKERYTADIFYKGNKFRIAHTCYKFGTDEHFVRNAILIGYECKHCGKKTMSWKRRDDILHIERGQLL